MSYPTYWFDAIRTLGSVCVQDFRIARKLFLLVLQPDVCLSVEEHFHLYVLVQSVLLCTMPIMTLFVKS